MSAQLPPWEELSLAEQVAQMIVVRASGYLFDHQIQYPQWEPTTAILQHWVTDLGVGGVILLGGSAAEVGLRSHQLQEWASIPLLIAADIEEGVGQRFTGAIWFPPPMALGAIAAHDLPKAIQLAEAMGSAIAQEALAIGINWVLAPVVDVNNNPQNPVINVRAFGETADIVSQLTTAFIRGTQQHPVLTAAKHFPGHGDTAIDSHLELPVLAHTRERLEELELVPFQTAIATGVDAVMTAHLRIPSLDTTYPATLSEPILTGLLRRQMQFEGLIVTDALIMGAIANQYGTNEAAVLAVEAGADIVLMPADPEGAIAAILHAVEEGRIAQEQIAHSVERIWQAKHKVCSAPLQGGTSHAWENVPPAPVQLEHLAQPLARETVAEILQASMQVHLPHEPAPVTHSTPLQNLIVVDEAVNCAFLGRQAPAIALPQHLGYQLQMVDSYTPTIAADTDQPATLLQLFIRGNPFRGSANLTQLASSVFHRLLNIDRLQALVIYGSPYILEHFIPKLPPHIPYVFTYGQFAEAQAIALQPLLNYLRQVSSPTTNMPTLSPDQQFTD
ncbi:beta-glucosidase [Oscillatoria sp. FACHB-1407]|uniref:glycoside hydrolase family 3 N-terminal domain-containing protein n=1 Tax=Oscillatoria sp. FACHB-1407 TaxID=2692847 RepID=UPI0016833F54|nr:glycoside hydrolase family 3 N-terminal domain-containing protein [Oscillatoria sp. FACHB-1407]MBD2463909.1 beta-glucosidase [Oscillatoria sp. FACHB-1407]